MNWKKADYGLLFFIVKGTISTLLLCYGSLIYFNLSYMQLFRTMVLIFITDFSHKFEDSFIDINKIKEKKS